MDSIPPADADFDAVNAQYQEIGDDTQEPAEFADGQELPVGNGRQTFSELRAIQRAMLALSLDDSVRPSERAQCARAYKELDILRCAKRGKPLTLSMTGKAEPKRSGKPAPLTIVGGSSAAA